MPSKMPDSIWTKLNFLNQIWIMWFGSSYIYLYKLHDTYLHTYGAHLWLIQCHRQPISKRIEIEIYTAVPLHDENSIWIHESFVWFGLQSVGFRLSFYYLYYEFYLSSEFIFLIWNWRLNLISNMNTENREWKLWEFRSIMFLLIGFHICKSIHVQVFNSHWSFVLIFVR